MAPNIFIFEIRLLDTAPLVWRIIELKNNSTLHDLHRVIQVAMGWKNAHLYFFTQTKNENPIEYRLPEYAQEDEPYHGNNPRNFKLKDIFSKAGEEIEYLYDFGDHWQHQVIFKGRKYERTTFGFPACTAGSMACPPEDVGGTHGYKILLKAIENKQKRELEEYKEWLGYHYDPYDFSVDRLFFLSKMIRKVQ